MYSSGIALERAGLSLGSAPRATAPQANSPNKNKDKAFLMVDFLIEVSGSREVL